MKNKALEMEVVSADEAVALDFQRAKEHAANIASVKAVTSYIGADHEYECSLSKTITFDVNESISGVKYKVNEGEAKSHEQILKLLKCVHQGNDYFEEYTEISEAKCRNGSPWLHSKPENDEEWIFSQIDKYEKKMVLEASESEGIKL
jgi:hypothetical protein